MRHRTLKATATAFALVLSVSAFWTATTNEMEGDDAANVVASAESETKVGTAEDGAAAEAEPKKKKGGWGRIFKAPLKAVGKLFKGDDGKLRRMSESDAARFESTPAMRVEDARTDEKRKERAESAESRSARDLLQRGRAALNEGEDGEAVRVLSRAAALDPKLSEAHNLLAVAYARRGLHERARDSFERSLDAQADAQALNNAGYYFYLNGHYRLAVERLKRAARLAPNDARILNNLALAQVRLGRFDDAYKNFARASNEYDAHMNTAALADRMGRDSEAAEHYEAAHRLRPASETALRRLADLYRRGGHSDRLARARRSLDELQAQLAAKE
ncbi:MAG TPA: tetratricopeptide repeat protein [Pyrinomonadaceae bacterium]|nr:tetratricopeptide repeat protein [Pyrinomonadaceae bacterium]